MGRPGGPGPLDPIWDVDTVFGAISYDNTPGTPRLPCTINQAAGQDDPTVDLPILFTALFSRAVTGFATGDVTITGTAGASTGVVTEVAPFDGTTYQVAVSDVTNEGTVVATILASVCTAVDDGMPNGHSTSTDNTVTYAVNFEDEFCDTFPSSPPVWDVNYTDSDWRLMTSGASGWTVSGGVASTNSLTPTKIIKHAATSDRNQYAQIVNKRDWSSGGNDLFRFLLNVGRDAEGTLAGVSSYYWGSMARVAGVPTIAVGKHWNGVDTQIDSMAYTVPLNSVFRFRHDGIGNLAIDVDDVEILTAFDNLVATASSNVFLRALGVGIGGIVETSPGSVVSISDFCSGIWGQGSSPPPEVPDPWYTADAVDTNSITGDPWTEEGSGTLTIAALSGNNTSAALSDSAATNFAALTDATELTADQFAEFTYGDANNSLDTTKQFKVLLRSSSTSTGYYFKFYTTGFFPFNQSFWEIGIEGGAALVTSADLGTSVASGRIRCEAQGTALRLKYNGTTQISTTNGSISAANRIRISPQGLGGGNGRIRNVVVGNL